ncbi:MAG TPA: metallophosphoesterase family protein [Roseiflexaceae bacterium]|nr:metallophosphoesterase family protein [Roseiflexaceae bacterium]
MHLAIISDIHGNCLALDAVLADLKAHPADEILCLGDAIQGGPQPAETVARLRALGCPVVMGNADAWLLTGEETGSEDITPERLRQLHEVRAWSLAQLSEADRAFIAGFAPTIELRLEGGRALLGFHGSPASFDDLILPHTPDEEFRRLLGPYADRLLCGGHTHVQQIRHLGTSFFFNPGSVGLAYRHDQPEEGFRADPWAEYALLTSDGARLALEFRRVPFDAAALIAVYRASGRPYAERAAAQYAPAPHPSGGIQSPSSAPESGASAV